MAKHVRVRTDEQRERWQRNRALLRAVLAGEQRVDSSSTQTAGLTLVLERFVADRSTWEPIAYAGDTGMERLLGRLAETYRDKPVYADGHLVETGGTIAIDGCEEPIAVRIGLGAGSQLHLAIGPSDDACAIRDAIGSFDRQFHLASTAIGCDYELVAQGYQPIVTDPTDIELVPGEEHRLADTYLSRRSDAFREWARCTAATRLRLPVESDEQAVGLYQLLTALSPVLAFLTDNTLHVRGSEPILTPLMPRTLIAYEAAPRRCDIPDEILGDGADLDSYEQWLEGIRPLSFASDDGQTIATGADTIEHLMCERELTATEAAHLTCAAWSTVRLLDGQVELACADSLPPRLAGAYLALLKGLVASEHARSSVARLVDLPSLDEGGILATWRSLRDEGWSARVYGRSVSQLANDLAVVASGGLDRLEERRMLAGLTQLWEVECIPRDLTQPSPDFDLLRASDQELVDLYSDVSTLRFDALDDPHPSGSTEVLRFRHLF